jgi:hypothetical protein
LFGRRGPGPQIFINRRVLFCPGGLQLAGSFQEFERALLLCAFIVFARLFWRHAADDSGGDGPVHMPDDGKRRARMCRM